MTIKQQFNEVKEELALITIITALVTGLEFGSSYSVYSAMPNISQMLKLSLLDSANTGLMTASALSASFVFARLAGYEVTKTQ